jgi:thioredoxin reductase (NADPH)
LELERVEGEGRLERVWLKSKSGDPALSEQADALFVFIGTLPHSSWLPPEVLRNDKGFVLTGRDLRPVEGFLKVWKEDREPFPLETSVAGLFAAGDVRAGAMNRVASAVGEGSMCVKLVSDYLTET